MLAHAIDNPAPSTIVLISGDRDFVYAVSILGLRKYRVVVIAPNAVHTSLKSQASAFYEWPRHVLPSEANYDGQCNIDNGPSVPSHRTGLPTPPDSARCTPTTHRTPSYFPSPSFHRGHTPSSSISHTRSAPAAHRWSPSIGSEASSSRVSASPTCVSGIPYTVSGLSILP